MIETPFPTTAIPSETSSFKAVLKMELLSKSSCNSLPDDTYIMSPFSDTSDTDEICAAYFSEPSILFIPFLSLSLKSCWNVLPYVKTSSCVRSRFSRSRILLVKTTYSLSSCATKNCFTSVFVIATTVIIVPMLKRSTPMVNTARIFLLIE